MTKLVEGAVGRFCRMFAELAADPSRVRARRFEGNDMARSTGTAMPVISQRIFDAIIRHTSCEKVRSDVLGYGNDEFLPWQVGAVM